MDESSCSRVLPLHATLYGLSVVVKCTLFPFFYVIGYILHDGVGYVCFVKFDCEFVKVYCVECFECLVLLLMFVVVVVFFIFSCCYCAIKQVYCYDCGTL